MWNIIFLFNRFFLNDLFNINQEKIFSIDFFARNRFYQRNIVYKSSEMSHFFEKLRAPLGEENRRGSREAGSSLLFRPENITSRGISTYRVTKVN